jgi:hypothetical protein
VSRRRRCECGIEASAVGHRGRWGLGLRLVCALGCVLAGSAACESAHKKLNESVAETELEQEIERHTGKTVDIDGSGTGILIEGKEDGQTARLDTLSGQLPPDWPSNVPVYPGSKVALSIKASKGWTVTLETPDSPDKVTEFYRDKMAGLQQRASMEIGGNRTMMWVDEQNSTQITLTVSTDDETRTNLFLMVNRVLGGQR